MRTILALFVMLVGARSAHAQDPVYTLKDLVGTWKAVQNGDKIQVEYSAKSVMTFSQGDEGKEAATCDELVRTTANQVMPETLGLVCKAASFDELAFIGVKFTNKDEVVLRPVDKKDQTPLTLTRVQP